MINVFISKRANDGILRVLEAMYEHLPKFGIQPTENINEADVINNHGTMLDERIGVPSVCSCHGLYWSRQPWDNGIQDVNRDVVESMRHAVAWTAPSEWVNTAIRRGGFWFPETVYHGIDGDKFLPSKTSDSYVLWAKARADYVSDPKDVMNLAYQMKDRQFRSTIGYASENLKILKPLPHAQMKQVMSQAGVYLSTARETFGIGTLEALAYGVPVAGWDWGGNSEIILQGVTGYLAPPGDYKALAECVELCFANRKQLSENAISDVRTRWKWEPRIEQYANIFKRVYSKWYANNPKVSVIVTAYKLDQFLPDCLDSVMHQTFTDFECIVIDDAGLESTRLIVSDYAKRDKRIRYVATPNNFGLPGARNYGLSLAVGKYIRHVDADDFMADNCLELEATALDTDRGADIVYGHLEVVRTDGSRVLQGREPVRGGWPPDQFNWYQQMAHLNQLPSCVMARREVYERSGGYRERMKRNEDAEFWCRVTSLGFRAKKFTQAVTYFHRERHDSKGATEWATEGAEPDWTSWFPWRLGGTDFKSAREVIQKRGEVPRNIYLVPFGAQGKPPRGLNFWYIHDYAYPVVSIIVTIGPGHKPYLIDALDSIQAQRYPDWECIVINDTGFEWDENIAGAPWAKVVNMNGNQGASAARNEGLKHARGKYVIWMDADDMWTPWLLETMVGYAEANDGVIYSDFLMDKNDKELGVFRYMDFQPQFLQSGCALPGSSVLIPKKYADRLLWDEKIEGIEDWDYQYQLCDSGVCFFHIPEPLFIYRMYSSTKREKDHAKGGIIVEYMDRKWSKYRTGKESLMCGCQQPKKPTSSTPNSLLSSSGNFKRDSVIAAVDVSDKNAMVIIEYTGDNTAPFTISSRFARNPYSNEMIKYRFANSDAHRYREVFMGDAEWLLGLMDGQGNPIYRMVGRNDSSNVNDPAVFAGKPIVA